MVYTKILGQLKAAVQFVYNTFGVIISWANAQTHQYIQLMCCNQRVATIHTYMYSSPFAAFYDVSCV